MADPQTFTFSNAVKKTRVGEAEVSTIRAPGGTGGRAFETVVFDGPQTEYGTSPQYLYDSEVAALAHHDALVGALQKGEALPDE